MIKIEKTEVYGWEAAIRGMRNSMNSWDRSDSEFHHFSQFNVDLVRHEYLDETFLGLNDCNLMLKLAKAGPVHAKYRRMITVTADIIAPLYWWKEFDTYKVGTVANSCSTMHKIHEKEFTVDDFSHEHMTNVTFKILLNTIIPKLNLLRDYYNSYEDESKHGPLNRRINTKKDIWYSMIQLLPSSYNQKRTVMLNYEILSHIYPDRKDHKLDEWRTFCYWIQILPYSKIITLEE